MNTDAIPSQPELIEPAEPSISEQAKRVLAITMLAVLSDGSNGWKNRAHFKTLGWSERQCRWAGEYSDGAIIFGPRGYRATVTATPDEIRRALATMEKVIRTTQTRVSALRKFAHARIG